MKVYSLVIILALIRTVFGADNFSIVIDRTKLEGNSLKGSISVNAETLGSTLENDEYRIPPGRYSGILRYVSFEQKNIVQNPGGNMGVTGDFLLEIGGVKDWKGGERTAILFHAGSMPSHSKGCILLGPVGKTIDGKPVLGKSNPLSKLRVAFYGTDTPDASPEKAITVEVKDTINREQTETKANVSGHNVGLAELNGVQMLKIDATHLRFENLTNTSKLVVFEFVATNPFLNKDETFHNMGITLAAKETQVYDHVGWTVVSAKLMSAKP